MNAEAETDQSTDTLTNRTSTISTRTMSLFSSNDENLCVPFGLHNGTRRFIDNLDQNKLEPENEIGNVEYKLRLIDPSPARIERLVSQLKWRIREGQGEAIVVIGVQDDGNLVGLTPDEVKSSMETLECMAEKIGATVTIVRERSVEDKKEHLCPKARNLERQRLCKENSSNNNNKNNQTRSSGISESSSSNSNNTRTVTHSRHNSITNHKSTNPTNNRKVLEVLVRKKTHDIPNELRAAVLGPTDSGKSSLLGVLSHSEYDNGRGSARLNLFRHRHEIKSGHTSSISQEILGFDSSGQAITYNQCLTAEEIIESADKIVTLIDLAGHQRYLSTTLFGLGSNSPDIVLLVVSAVSQISLVTEELISLALGIGQSLVIVINKIDLASREEQNHCCEILVRTLMKCSPSSEFKRVLDADDAGCVSSRLRNENITPIFFTSCVTGAGLNLLYEFFNRLAPSLNSTDLELALNLPSELQIDETFLVPGTGVVVSGLLVNGVVREGDKMLLGPDNGGSFEQVYIVSLQRHKVPCATVRAGQCCTLAIKSDSHNNLLARKGMILRELDHDWLNNFPVCLYFKAQIRLIGNHNQKIGIGCQVSIYVGNVKQTCSIISANEENLLGSSDTSLYCVLFRFMKRPEYVKPRSKLMLRHAFMKGIGIVLEVYNINDICKPTNFFV